MRALIGHTGFVGSCLDGPDFNARFNSSNSEDARGRQFDEVVCAGVQAVKWWANKNPDKDWAGIQRLLDVLATMKAERFVLISTVDVYHDPVAVDETTPIRTDGLHSYGLHRHRVEEFVRNRFGDAAVIVRLPGLFGPGLKKNLIFDLLEGRDVSGFDARSEFQFYDLSRLSQDLDLIRSAGLKTVNLAVEPVSVAEVAERITAERYDRRTDTAPLKYDMQTVHAPVWGRPGRYLEDAESCLARIGAFAEGWTRA